MNAAALTLFIIHLCLRIAPNLHICKWLATVRICFLLPPSHAVCMHSSDSSSLSRIFPRIPSPDSSSPSCTGIGGTESEGQHGVDCASGCIILHVFNSTRSVKAGSVRTLCRETTARIDVRFMHAVSLVVDGRGV